MDRAAEDVLSGVESLVSSRPPPAVSLSSCLSLPVSSSSCPPPAVSLSSCLSLPVSSSSCPPPAVSLSSCLSLPVSSSSCPPPAVSLSSCLSLPVSSSSCPPPAVSLSSCLSLPVSSSSFPLSSSRQVTACLYSSLQHSQEQEVKGHQAETHRSLTARQVSFKVTSPLVTMTTAAPPLRSDELSESQVESQSEPITEEMELKPQSSARLLSGRRHIEEMENVRSHLQTILRTTETHELLPSTLQHLQHESDTTSHLLSGVEDLFPRYSRLRADFDSAPFHTVSELQVIRESLERERARRKHSEQQLLAVQSKALELQQQLALAVSADRKKDIMIEQLDKTLEKVVEGWRRHEREKSEGVRRLQEEKQTAENTQRKQREALDCLEKSLSEATETLDKEQMRNENLERTNKQLECDMVQLRVCVCELEQEVERLHADQKTETEKLHTHNLDLQQQLEQHQVQAKHTHTHLQQELKLLTQQLETESERVGQEVQLRQEALSRLQQLQQDVEETRRERDTTRVDRALDQARFEAQRSQWEVELRLSVEQQVTERLATTQEENANATAKLREQHRKQLLDLSAHHEREFSVQADEFRAQLKERDDRQHQLTLEYNKKMAELQKELVSMETSKRRLESQREELVSRLQGMMRSHWAEALRLLTNQEQNEELISSSSFQDTFKTHLSPRSQTQDINICGTAAPQAVVLQLCRDRVRGIRGQGDSGGDRGRVESDFSLLNHSHIFSPLEPVLDDTHLTAGGGGVGDGDLWDRPVGGERQTVRQIRGERTPSGANLTLHSTPLTHDSFCEVNHSIVQSEQRDTRLRAHQRHASTDVWANQSSETGAGPGDVSQHMYSTAALPTQEHDLSVKMRAPPPAASHSSVCDERQNELQYYIAKLLERSPGEPLYEHQEEPSKTRAEKRSANPGVSSQVELKLEQLADLLHLTLPSTHTPQQLQQHLDSFMRSGEVCSDPVGANLDHRLTQNNRKERQSASRPTHHTATRGQRVGPQGQRQKQRDGQGAERRTDRERSDGRTGSGATDAVTCRRICDL